ncbi:regulatory protein RecX [Candidatus Formimonas warabiya]|uniref:regulatory protein RecX n=1 Tax=Formimonas warabiya TaxID=1761012 RepID=UPI001BE49E1E|nr:regulatory protein RecX [Candidatus Formimonas warabiya]
MKQKNALTYALKLLNLRPRSKEEMKKVLAAHDYPVEEINQVVFSLVQLDYLNDVKFMESWCYYRKQISPRGRWFVKRELHVKGISVQDLEAYFDHFYSLEEEKDCLDRLIHKQATRKMGSGNICAETEKEQHKIFSSLMRKGFDRELIFQALNLLQPK